MIYYIYKIVCNDVSITDFYVGSTSNVRHRKWEHKSACQILNNKSYNQKIYQTIRENGGWDNWRMIVLEEMIEGTTLLQSRMREEYFRLELQATLNSYCCGTGLNKKDYDKIYYDINKDKRKKQDKIYRDANKDEINRKKREKYALKKQTNNEI
jgi:hypothetical protein